MLATTSCTEDPMIDGGEEATVSFTIGTPEIATRAYSEAGFITTIQYYVYAGNERLEQLCGTVDVDAAKKANFSLKLKNNKEYNIIFILICQYL